ncbi:hypothetical protein VXQ18_09800 [Brucella abortus]|nr:hypothetical protein [Brucella abortus]
MPERTAAVMFVALYLQFLPFSVPKRICFGALIACSAHELNLYLACRFPANRQLNPSSGEASFWRLTCCNWRGCSISPAGCKNPSIVHRCDHCARSSSQRPLFPRFATR